VSPAEIAPGVNPASVSGIRHAEPGERKTERLMRTDLVVLQR
jgi:hypothetical protein